MKIAVFDSGIGGITVLRELRRRFSDESFLYFGDTANVPYGTKSVSQVEQLCDSAAQRMHLHAADCFIIACNTASSLALSRMKAILAPAPVLGVVEAGVAAIRENHAVGTPVLVLGTRATVKSKIYRRLLTEAGIAAPIYEQACPLLVPMIEEGWRDHAILHLTLAEYVTPYRDLQPGVALLACTHYPWIKSAFEAALPGWTILDSATAVADQFFRECAVIENAQGKGRVSWHFSDPEAVAIGLLESVAGKCGVEVF